MTTLIPCYPSRTLWLVGLASLGWAVSFGLLAALAPLWLSEAGLSTTSIGLNTALYDSTTSA